MTAESHTFCGTFHAVNGDFTFITFGLEYGKWVESKDEMPVLDKNGRIDVSKEIIPKVGQVLYNNTRTVFCSSGTYGSPRGTEGAIFVRGPKKGIKKLYFDVPFWSFTYSHSEKDVWVENLIDVKATVTQASRHYRISYELSYL